jgi:uncharacterized membrane protein
MNNDQVGGLTMIAIGLVFLGLGLGLGIHEIFPLYIRISLFPLAVGSYHLYIGTYARKRGRPFILAERSREMVYGVICLLIGAIMLESILLRIGLHAKTFPLFLVSLGTIGVGLYFMYRDFMHQERRNNGFKKLDEEESRGEQEEK